MSKRLLIISTHPDDETLSFGGLMARAKRRGDQVWLHTFCVGGPASNVATEIRLEELKNVAKYFGVHELSWDDRELDGKLSTVNNCELTANIDKLIRTIRPEEVYCTAMSEHSDHIATVQAFKGAARLKTGYMPKLFAIGTYPFSDQLYSMPDGGKIFQPMSEELFLEKCEAFKLHQSQFKPSPSPLGIDGIETQARYYGMMCGHKYAELYYQLRYIRCE
jgi:LmbE family N-acetylglucosaminyl deacetylase